jgi:DNA-binding transcriptional ArsR family regulator
MPQTLLRSLFPQVRAEILRLPFTNPRTELYVRELARLSGLSLQTVQDELAKLEAARLITSRSNGYHRFYRADSKHPLYATLRKLAERAATAKFWSWRRSRPTFIVCRSASLERRGFPSPTIRFGSLPGSFAVLQRLKARPFASRSVTAAFQEVASASKSWRTWLSTWPAAPSRATASSDRC